jgi:hypothetical protein
MRLDLPIALLAALVLAMPAQAGTLTYSEGRGSWQSTRCAPPQQPAFLSQNPETPANDLNAQMEQHNAFAAATQSYMNCISQEAQGDAEAANQIIIRTAQGLIEQAQSQVGASATEMQRRQ